MSTMLPGEAETVEDRLADIIVDGGKVWIGGYLLSPSDTERVVLALRQAGSKLRKGPIEHFPNLPRRE